MLLPESTCTRESSVDGKNYEGSWKAWNGTVQPVLRQCALHRKILPTSMLHVGNLRPLFVAMLQPMMTPPSFSIFLFLFCHLSHTYAMSLSLLFLSVAASPCLCFALPLYSGFLTHCELVGLNASQNYEVRLCAVSSSKRTSPWSECTHASTTGEKESMNFAAPADLFILCCISWCCLSNMCSASVSHRLRKSPCSRFFKISE